MTYKDLVEAIREMINDCDADGFPYLAAEDIALFILNNRDDVMGACGE